MPSRKMRNVWFDLMMLGIESQRAVALRLLALSTGGARARRESRTMVSEKLQAGLNASHRFAGGAAPATIVKSYRTKDRANIRRLSK